MQISNFYFKFILIISFLAISVSCSSRKPVIKEKVTIKNEIIIDEPIIETTYIPPKEVKEPYNINGFINKVRNKQLKEDFDLRAMKFTAYLFDKLVCMNYMNTLFTSDIKSRFTDNYAPKFDPKFSKDLNGKYNYFWSNEYGNTILKFGDKEQGIYGCGQIIFSTVNSSDLKYDVSKMISILNPIAKELVLDKPWQKLGYINFTDACKVYFRNNLNTVVINFQKKLPAFPTMSDPLVNDYKKTRLAVSSYVNNAMFKGCTGQYISDQSYKKNIEAFVANYIFCKECDNQN